MDNNYTRIRSHQTISIEQNSNGCVDSQFGECIGQKEREHEYLPSPVFEPGDGIRRGIQKIMEITVVAMATIKDWIMDDTRLSCPNTYAHQSNPHSSGSTCGTLYSLAKASISMLSSGP